MNKKGKTKQDDTVSNGAHTASSDAASNAPKHQTEPVDTKGSKASDKAAHKEAKKQAKQNKKQSKQSKKQAKQNKKQAETSKNANKQQAKQSKNSNKKQASAPQPSQSSKDSEPKSTSQSKQETKTSQPPVHQQPSAGAQVNADKTQKMPATPPQNAAAGTTQVMPQASEQAVYAGAASGTSTMLPVDQAGAVKGKKKKHRVARGLLITLGVIIVLAAALYAGVALYFTDRFMPDTHAGTIQLSYMSSSEAEDALMDKVDNYSLTISGDDFALDLSSSDASLTMDTEAVVKSMLDEVNPWLWPTWIFQDHDESDKLVASSNGESLDKLINDAVDEFNKHAEQPTNATIKYSKDDKAFVIQDEKIGTALDAKKVIKKAEKALSTLNSEVTLDEDDLLQPTVFSTDKELATAADDANKMLKAKLTLTLGDDTVATIDADQISKWVKLSKKLKASLSTDKLTEWAENLADKYDTVGTTRTYKRDGKKIKVSGGSYGWAIDTDSLVDTVKSAIKKGKKSTEEVPCDSKAARFEGQGKRDWGKRYCDIDLSEQHVYFYDDSGKQVWSADCVSGLPDGKRDTPTGVYYILDKESPSVLVGYENGEKSYESEVTYWMPFVGNSVGLHDATWQSAFGGDRYKTYGSHGCVNLSYSKAEALYGIIEVGDVVVCHW